ncbi:MAG: MerR family transcriptional regulator, partial [Akkermansiaceae bacterium]|nr:MerR family transcriptional regulator [Akkermansiaceae bacterium]
MENSLQDVYGIAAVAKRTGLATPNIRMWEKRHQAVVPARTDTNRRLYSAEDIERLILMKQLTDRGHAISTIAGLSLLQLGERCDHELASVDEASGSASRKSFMTIGPVVAALTEDEEFLNAVAVAGYDTIEDAEADSELVPVDLLVIET